MYMINVIKSFLSNLISHGAIRKHEKELLDHSNFRCLLTFTSF